MSVKRFPLAVAAVSVLALAACQPPLEGQTTENTERGALIGAGVGALAGVLTGDDRNDRIQRGITGAIIGGGAGAAIGNNLDRQEAELRQQLGSNVGIVNNGNSLTVTLPQDILFATNSTAISGALQNDLRAVAGSLNRYPDTRVNVIGHTDNVGDAGFNLDLSQRRAAAVANVLTGAGVASFRINTIGRGEDQPIATNQTAAGRQLNRRVEIVITPNQ